MNARAAVFVDTSAWYALADRGDRHHTEAAQLLTQAVAGRQHLLTTNGVISESYALIRVRLGFVASQEFLKRLRTSSHTERVFVSETAELEAEALLSRYADQDFSYVDATSFVTMRLRRLTTAFAFDQHFIVAGFTLLTLA